MSDTNIIAIDGPVASGKGTVAKELSKRFHGFHLSTGLVYRGIGLYCKEHKINLESEESIVKATKDINISITKSKVLLNGKDISNIVVQDEAGDLASKVSIHKKVRLFAVAQQKKIIKKALKLYPFVVIEGRDTGTVLAPDAKLKIFLTSDLSSRSKRRHKQLFQNTNISIEDMQESIKERDKRDTSRKHSPLVKEPEKYGYITLDNTNQTINETVQTIAKQMKDAKIM